MDLRAPEWFSPVLSRGSLLGFVPVSGLLKTYKWKDQVSNVIKKWKGAWRAVMSGKRWSRELLQLCFEVQCQHPSRQTRDWKADRNPVQIRYLLGKLALEWGIKSTENTPTFLSDRHCCTCFTLILSVACACAPVIERAHAKGITGGRRRGGGGAAAPSMGVCVPHSSSYRLG